MKFIAMWFAISAGLTSLPGCQNADLPPSSSGENSEISAQSQDFRNVSLVGKSFTVAARGLTRDVRGTGRMTFDKSTVTIWQWMPRPLKRDSEGHFTNVQHTDEEKLELAKEYPHGVWIKTVMAPYSVAEDNLCIDYPHAKATPEYEAYGNDQEIRAIRFGEKPQKFYELIYGDQALKIPEPDVYPLILDKEVGPPSVPEGSVKLSGKTFSRKDSSRRFVFSNSTVTIQNRDKNSWYDSIAAPYKLIGTTLRIEYPRATLMRSTGNDCEDRFIRDGQLQPFIYTMTHSFQTMEGILPGISEQYDSEQ